MQIPQIGIRQQHASLFIDADIGKQHIEQPKATVDMEQVEAVQQFQTTQGRLDINQDRMWDALAMGNSLETMSRIYSAASSIALQGLARIVEKGDQMAAIHLGGNPIAEMARDWKRTFPEFDFVGEASFDNIDITYTPGELSIETTRGGVNINVQVNKPIHEYERGKLEIYMSQYPKVEFIPPQIDQLL
ncbi:hypothetical protein I6N90_22760 [Paenibacillus sp. GSMTC-2017]|uniref:DUF6470 family protein n=1 Tax=Paenibacillus sp. GSMTC-2017 TaxID=2794350 RepID=UPI0018D8CEE7|nr:DUF6470 family protein [Paenibacillus sp. GSMTC-2017]MBH5320620.1 hypothetical protein [Paenibacillus sp. GSMTC-2017]